MSPIRCIQGLAYASSMLLLYQRYGRIVSSICRNEFVDGAAGFFVIDSILSALGSVVGSVKSWRRQSQQSTFQLCSSHEPLLTSTWDVTRKLLEKEREEYIENEGFRVTPWLPSNWNCQRHNQGRYIHHIHRPHACFSWSSATLCNHQWNCPRPRTIM